MNVDFWNHHTPHGQAFDKTTREAVAKANHEARARDGRNTTLDMSGEDAQREICRYLEDLGDHDTASAALDDHRSITFETRGEYLFVTTEWNRGDPVSYQVDRGHAIVRMQYNHGSYQIYHLDGMS